MARQCMVTGKKTMVGNNVSHSNRKVRRTFIPNLQWKKVWVPSENSSEGSKGHFIRLRICGKGLKTIDKQGIEAVLTKLRANGTI